MKKYPVYTAKRTYLVRIKKRESRNFFGIRYELSARVYLKIQPIAWMPPFFKLVRKHKGTVTEYEEWYLRNFIEEAVAEYEKQAEANDKILGWDGDMR